MSKSTVKIQPLPLAALVRELQYRLGGIQEDLPWTKRVARMLAKATDPGRGVP